MSAEMLSALASVVSAITAVVAILAGKNALDKQTQLTLDEMRDARRRAAEEQLRAARASLHLALRGLAHEGSSKSAMELKIATEAIRAQVDQYGERAIQEARNRLWMAAVQDIAQGTSETRAHVDEELARLETEIHIAEAEMSATAKLGFPLEA